MCSGLVTFMNCFQGCNNCYLAEQFSRWNSTRQGNEWDSRFGGNISSLLRTGDNPFHPFTYSSCNSVENGIYRPGIPFLSDHRTFYISKRLEVYEWLHVCKIEQSFVFSLFKKQTARI